MTKVNHSQHSKSVQCSPLFAGFSIVELSITMVLIGLLLVAITYGSSLIGQTKVKESIAEIMHSSSVLDRFFDKYNAWPGDYGGAYALWGSACASSASLCNGNNNGIIEWSNTTDDVESLRAWQHLYLAGMLDQDYSGVAATPGQSEPGINIPQSVWGGEAGIELYTAASATFGPNGPALQIAGKTLNGPASSANVMTPAEALALDTKIDDGVGSTGRVLGFYSGSANTCLGGDNTNYNQAIDNRACMVRYLLRYQ